MNFSDLTELCRLPSSSSRKSSRIVKPKSQSQHKKSVKEYEETYTENYR